MWKEASNKTTCCSTNSKKPHFCHHLFYMVEKNDHTLHIPHTFYNGLGYAPKNCPLLLGDPGPHRVNGSMGTPESICQTAARSVQPLAQLTVVTNTETHAERDQGTLATVSHILWFA